MSCFFCGHWRRKWTVRLQEDQMSVSVGCRSPRKGNAPLPLPHDDLTGKRKLVPGQVPSRGMTKRITFIRNIIGLNSRRRFRMWKFKLFKRSGFRFFQFSIVLIVASAQTGLFVFPNRSPASRGIYQQL